MISGDNKNKNGEDRTNRNPWQEAREEEGPKAWSILLVALIGATVTTYAVGQLRRTGTADWFYTQTRRRAASGSSRGTASGSSRGSFREESWNRYNRRIQEEYEEEMERVERIKRMQSVFNRERNKYKKSYESWSGNDSGADQYHQHFQRNDWYWKTDPFYKDQRANSKATPRHSGSYSMSHHYSVLGLDRSRARLYSDTEIKSAFRAKAMEYHPDQNQHNKEVAEAKFKEVMSSYEAIKLERKNDTS